MKSSHRPPRFSSIKAPALFALCLAGLSLFALLPSPVRAQSGNWAVTDGSSHALTQNNDGSYTLTGTMSGAASNTYPQNLIPSSVGALMSGGPWASGIFSPFPYGFSSSSGPYQNPLYPPLAGTSFPADSSGTTIDADGVAVSGYPNSLTDPVTHSPDLLRGSVQSQVSGTLGATFTWNGAGSAPDHLDLLVNTQVNVWGVVRDWDFPALPADVIADTSCAATASDGLGESAVVNSATTPVTTPSGLAEDDYNQSSGGRHLVRVPVVNGAATYSLGAQASMNVSNNVSSSYGNSDYYPLVSATGSVSATAEPVAYDAAIILTGPAQDGDGNWDILIGQGCTASLGVSGLPSGSEITDYQWSVTGTTFQSWAVVNDPNNQSHTTEVDGPGPLTNPMASWYWNDLHQANETVSCTATVILPDGTRVTVGASQVVNVFVPNWAAYGVGGTMRVDAALATGNGSDYYFYAGPATSTHKGGMDLYASLSPLDPNPAGFGLGTLQLVQLVTPNRTYTNNLHIVYDWSINRQEGLDKTYPYPWAGFIGPSYASNDSPNFDLTAYSAIGATMQDQFEDYLMYFAPGSSQCVPVARFEWNTDGNVTIPASGSWGDFTGSAGTVTPSGDDSMFLPLNEFPAWTQINNAQTASWVMSGISP